MRLRGVTATGVVLALGLAACSSGDTGPEPITGGDQQPDADDVPEPEPEPDPEPEPETGPEDDIAARWVEFQQVWHDQLAADGDADPTAFEGLAEDPDQWAGLVDALPREDRILALEVEHWTEVDLDGDEARIGDCIIALEHLAIHDPDDAEHGSTWWTATAVRDGDDWLIRSRNEDRSGPCVAAELNDQLLAAYEDYRQVKNDAWDPPDPDHPELDQVATGEQLEFLRELISEDREAGLVFREPAPTDQAVVFDLEIGFAVVSDCTEQVPEYGVYDLETGERLDDEEEPVGDGRVDLQSVELLRQNGNWKAQQQGAARDSNCQPGATDHVIR